MLHVLCIIVPVIKTFCDKLERHDGGGQHIWVTKFDLPLIIIDESLAVVSAVRLHT